MRFMLGFTQAFSVIYAPVWVNEFSPRRSSTIWIATMHMFTVVGVLIGYIVGSLSIGVLSEILGWRGAF